MVRFLYVKYTKTLTSFLVAEALTDLIYHRPPGKNSSFQFTLCQMMGEVSAETSPT